eukprot:scaffold66760_cov19-Tisochrysis_lutea.AAC.2
MKAACQPSPTGTMLSRHILCSLLAHDIHPCPSKKRVCPPSSSDHLFDAIRTQQPSRQRLVSGVSQECIQTRC